MKKTTVVLDEELLKAAMQAVSGSIQERSPRGRVAGFDAPMATAGTHPRAGHV